jgi:hypothetical protein
VADNVQITQGSGTTIGTDEVTNLNGSTVSAVQIQRVKLCHGTDGSAKDTSTQDPVPTAPQSGGSAVSPTNPLPVAGQAVPIQATMARPADTSAYTAFDTISTSTSTPAVITFSNVARINGGTGYITKARGVTNQVTCTARTRLHLYNVAPTAINDNAPQTLLYANRAGYQGSIDLGAYSTEATGSDCAVAANTSPRMPFACAGGDRNLYGMLETLDAFTPASAQGFFTELMAELN